MKIDNSSVAHLVNSLMNQSFHSPMCHSDYIVTLLFVVAQLSYCDNTLYNLREQNQMVLSCMKCDLSVFNLILFFSFFVNITMEKYCSK